MLLWAITLAVAGTLIHRLRKSSVGTEPQNSSPSELVYTTNAYKLAQQQLLKALRQKDLLAIKEALLTWASQYHQQPVYGLDQAASMTGGELLTQQLNALQSNLYGQPNSDWSPTEVSKVIEQKKKPITNDKTGKENLPPLYL